MLYFGYSVKNKENRINSLLRNFALARELSVPELMRNTGYTEKFLIEAVRVINKSGLGYYVWNLNHTQ